MSLPKINGEKFHYGQKQRKSKNKVDGWMEDLRFYVLLTVFQSYQDDVWMIMKGCVCNGSPFTVEKISFE